ncbi:MAG TPA: MDR family MFS transporter [Stellaceae bacterium]|nr:MDR family MFS transporter [Stellaceae bacterium]
MPHARRRLITIACLLAQFMAAVESTIVGTAMPTIVGDLGGFHLFSWVFASYLLAQAVSTPVYGRLSDVYGRKRLFFAGAALFLVGSTACGFAWGMVPLIAFRAVQGLGAGAIQPIAWTIIGDIYPPADRARMQGWLSSVFGVSALVGPLLGAFIVEHLNWSLVFWVNLPIGIAAVVTLALVLDERIEGARRKVDYLGALLLMLGVGAILVALVQSRSLGAEAIAGLVAFGAAALALLCLHELRVAEPIVPFRLWRHPLIAIGNFGAFIIGVMMMCNGGYLPAYVQGAMGRSPAVAGLVLGSSSVVWTVGTILSGRVMVRSSYRAAGVTGSLIVLVGVAVSLMLEPSRGPVWAAFGASLLGLGMGFCNTTFIVSVQTAVGWGERGAVTGANLFMRTIGQAMGAALFGYVLSAGVARHVPEAGDAINRLLQPGMRASLAPDLALRLSDALAGAMHEAYIVLGVIALVVLGFTCAIPARLSPTRLSTPPQARLAPGHADD